MTTGSKRKAAKAHSSPRATGFPLAPLDVLAHATEAAPIASRLAALRRRLRDPDVPDDVRDLAAGLIDHAERLEMTLQLWEDAANARLREAASARARGDR